MFATTHKSRALKNHYFWLLFYEQVHKIVQYLSTCETWVKDRHQKVLLVYVTTTMIFYAIPSQKMRTPHALRQEYGNRLPSLRWFYRWSVIHTSSVSAAIWYLRVTWVWMQPPPKLDAPGLNNGYTPLKIQYIFFA